MFSLEAHSTRPESASSPEVIGSHLFRKQRETSRFPSIAARDFNADTYYSQPRAFGTRPRFDRASFEAPSGPPVSGVVKWFSPEKAFGFVELSDGSGDGFLHGSVLARSGISVVQPGETLEVRVGPGHKGPHVTEVLSVDSSAAVPMASRGSSAQVTTSNGPSVEETGMVKWFNVQKGYGLSLGMTAARTCSCTSRPLNDPGSAASTKGNPSFSILSKAEGVWKRREFA